jgi:hypothetical protein
LIQGNQFFDRGTLWILSGANAGKVVEVLSYASNQLTFADLGDDPIEAGDRYAVARAIYPLPILIASVNDALNETFVIDEAVDDNGDPLTYTGDGQLLDFELINGERRITNIELQDPNNTEHTYPSSHWRERSGHLIFASGCAPLTDWIVHVYTRQDHQISDEWLRWKAAEYALYWGVGTYGEQKEYRIEERLNRALGKLKTLRARIPMITLQSVA